jgi:hypothetical protein
LLSPSQSYSQYLKSSNSFGPVIEWTLKHSKKVKYALTFRNLTRLDYFENRDCIWICQRLGFSFMGCLSHRCSLLLLFHSKILPAIYWEHTNSSFCAKHPFKYLILTTTLSIVIFFLILRRNYNHY